MPDIEKVFEAIAAQGLMRNPRCIGSADADDDIVIEGDSIVEGRTVTLQIVIATSFPLVLPRIALRPWDALGIIPHIDINGTVCYTETEGAIWDTAAPIPLITEAVERAVAVLGRGVRGENVADFADEFEAYWNQLPGALSAPSMLDPRDEVAEIWVGFNEQKLSWIAGDPHDVSEFHNGTKIPASTMLQRALYLPLMPGTCIVPPHPGRPFWGAADARRILIRALSEANMARLRKLTKHRKRLRDYAIVRLLRPSGGATLFGLRYDSIGAIHPLRDGGTAQRLVPLCLTRRDRTYLVRRGGGHEDLSAKRVLLAGCGAVGGHLAFELARAGVLRMTLVDPQFLTADNTFRHVLGRASWGKPKAEALKAAIEDQLPYARVTAIAQSVESALSVGAIDLKKYDLIVLALGNPTVELAINERIHSLPVPPRTVFTWLEPLGIGGHALLTSNGRDGGCFACLYMSSEGMPDLAVNRASFAAPHQTFGRRLSGCASAHTPYGSADAQRTANLAVRLAIDALSGVELGRPLLSWKGDPRQFEAEGYHVSRRYRDSEQQLHADRFEYKSPFCMVCGDHGGRDLR